MTTRKGDLDLGIHFKPEYDYTRTELIDGLNLLLTRFDLKVIDYSF